MMARYWASWWSGNYADEGCTAPPFEFWVSGQRERRDGGEKDDCSICAVIDAEDEDAVEGLIKNHFPDYEMRFCELRASDFFPSPDRFPGRHGVEQ